MFWIGLTLVVMVMVGRARIHIWALWLPNLVIRQITGRKAAVAVPEAGKPGSARPCARYAASMASDRVSGLGARR
mgnify:CR=1 FL=1